MPHDLSDASHWLVPNDRRLAVRVSKDALRQIRGGHPWIYDQAITSVSHAGKAGDLAVIFDQDRRFVAIGLWDPLSPIRVRILHHGKPTPIDHYFWLTRISDALLRRQSLLDSAGTTAYRLVHGENDLLPSLVIDQYDNVAVVKLYSEAWLPHLRNVLAALLELVELESIVLRLARNVSGRTGLAFADGETLYGLTLPDPVAFLENGLTFKAEPVIGQKTGYFLDQRDNRQLVRHHSAGGRVLDVFCGHGGFSVHAAAGGARHVHSTDLSPHAIDAAADNMVANRSAFPDPTKHRTTVGDAFEVMEALTVAGSRYDLVVIDPPSFAPNRASIGRAQRAYQRLTHLGIGLVTPGGLLLQASCSSRVDADSFFAGIHYVAASRSVSLTEIERTGHPVDHPIGFVHGRYLKALLGRVG